MLMSIMRRSKVKSENHLSDNNQIATQTKNLNNEIVSLSSQTSLKDEYIGDVEDSLRLNKQAVHILFRAQAAEQGRAGLLDRFESVSRQNLQLLEQMRREREAKEAACAERLIKEQIRTQDEEFFQQRVVEMDTRVDDLRKTMQDKQYNYYVIAERLSVFEEIEENFISYTNYSHNSVLADKQANKVVAKLSSEKYRLQEEIKEARKELLALKLEDRRLRNAVQAGWGWDQLRRLRDREEVVSEGIAAPFENQQGQLNPIAIAMEKAQPSQSIEQLLKILKKEKTSYTLLKISFKQSVEVEEKLKRYEKKLITNNRKLKEKFESHLEHIQHLQACMKKQLLRNSKGDFPFKIDFNKPRESKPQIAKQQIARPQFDPKLSPKTKKALLLIRSSSQPQLTPLTQSWLSQQL